MTGLHGQRPLRKAVALLVLLSACWALVSPLGSVPDEPAHVVYAAAVVRGDLGDGPLGRDVTVPRGVASAGVAACTAFKPGVTADCRPDLGGDQEPVQTSTGAGRYPPLYYALVGWPTRLTFGELTWYAMRLLSVLLGGLLLLLATTTWQRSPSPVVLGLLLAGTPMAGFLLGSVNPNGVEIVAGVALVLAGGGVADRLRRGAPAARRDVVVLALLTACLAVARPGSYLLAAALLGVLLLAVADVVQRRWRVSCELAVVLAGVLGAAVVAARATALPAPPAPEGGAVTYATAWATTLATAVDWMQETVGIFGWRDHQPPPVFRWAWLAAVAVLCLVAVLRGSTLERLSLGGLLVGATVLAPFFVFLTLFRDGVGYQARYAMALTQAVPVLAGAVLARHEVRLPAVARSLPPVVMALSALALLGSAARYGTGLPLPGPSSWADRLVWLPPGWPLVLLLLTVCAVLAVRLGDDLTVEQGEQRVPPRASITT